MRNIATLAGRCIVPGAVALASLVLASAASGSNVGHYREIVLDSFCAPDCSGGKHPIAGLIADADGNLYGTTELGGFTPGCNGSGCGTVFEFELTPNRRYREKVLYRFCAQGDCLDGKYPGAGLIVDAQSNLYGTTSQGGANGFGTVFKLSPNDRGRYKETVLYSFCAQANCADGAAPLSRLIADPQGNLYGTTSGGGTDGDGRCNGGCGTVFKLTPNDDGPYAETVLYTFCSQANCADGLGPTGDLIADAQGNLYGTTGSGGANASNSGGTVFKLTPHNNGQYTHTILYNFCAQDFCADGAAPQALIADAQGNLYGTTNGGGAPSADYCTNLNGGCGTVFKLTPNGRRGYRETVLHSFCSQANCVDGQYPAAGVIVDAQGNLYGTTSHGGANCIGGRQYNGCGTVFALTPNDTGRRYRETVLYSFGAQPDSADGEQPEAGLIADSQGNLYGTTSIGGDDTVAGGTVFELRKRQ